MKKGEKGWTGPLSERLDLMVPVEVDDDGNGLGEQIGVFEFYPDIWRESWSSQG